MRGGGLVLVIAGVLVLCQVLGGDALNRLGLTGQGDDDSAGDKKEFPNVPDRGYNDVPHDAQGRPL
jgi:hypothetical protein